MFSTLNDILERIVEHIDTSKIERRAHNKIIVGFQEDYTPVQSIRIDDDGVRIEETGEHAQVVVRGTLDSIMKLLKASDAPVTHRPDDLFITPPTKLAHEQVAKLLQTLGVDFWPVVEALPEPKSSYFEKPLRHPVGENRFLTLKNDPKPLPTYDPDTLPKLILADYPATVAVYAKAWELAFKNLRQPEPDSGFVASFIDTAFNDNTFIWDSAFMTMFGRYATHIFNFMGTLDNFYGKQHPDGYICREINTYTGEDKWIPGEGRSTGPNIFAWTEWLNYQTTGKVDDLRKVYPALLGYHRWWKDWRTYRDGSYWTTGLASGMDNQSRVPDAAAHHRGYVWLDAMMQQALSCYTLLQIGRELGDSVLDQYTALIDSLSVEYALLEEFINEHLWNEKTRFYHDLAPDGSHSSVKSIGAYWGLLADVVPKDRAKMMIAHLRDETTFNRPHRVPSQAADSVGYREDGQYWLGGVWSPTNYMILRGLTQHMEHDLAYEIAKNHVAMVTEVFEDTGTLWETYTPEYAAKGNPARGDFVGWTGVSAITIPIEYIVGLQSDENNRIRWDIRESGEHGVERYLLPDGTTADFVCEAAEDHSTRHLTIRAESAFTLVTHFAGSARVHEIEAGTQRIELRSE